MGIIFGPSPVNIPVGTTQFGPAVVEDGVTIIKFGFTVWAQANRSLSAVFEFSTDSGVTWANFGGINPTPGGTGFHDKSGNAEYSAIFGPMPTGTGRQARIQATATGGPVNTTVTITTS